MGYMKVVEGDFSGLEILFFLAVGESWGPGSHVISWPTVQRNRWPGVVPTSVTMEGQWMELCQAQNGPGIFVSPVLFSRGIVSGTWLL